MIDPGSVRVGVLVDDEHGLTGSFLKSFLPFLATDLAGQQRIWRGGYAFQSCSSVGVVEGRNEVTRSFLESDAEWLLFIDADMGWDADALEKLMAAADKVHRPIVGGLCFGFGPITDRLDHAQAIVKRPFPTIFDVGETEKDGLGFRARWWYQTNTVQQCAATGAAMLLIHRGVFEAMSEEWPGVGWFDRMKHPQAKKLWGEDTSFCMRAGLLGIPVHVHAGVKTSHMKSIYVTESTYYSQLIAQPATERVAVIVPVLRRPEHAKPFMESLRASTGLATVYAVCSEESDAEAWHDAGAWVIRTKRISFAEKINDAFAEPGLLTHDSPLGSFISEPWVFITGDDVKFYPGWLDHAQQVARNTGAQVVGTNDLGNDRVMDGDHATHMLISREYIDQQGASWDGPGVVCHEGYRHWFVDDEIVTAAKQRGVWAPALASIVEHLHPAWGKAESDDTYVRGQRYAERDHATFKKRLSEHKAVAA